MRQYKMRVKPLAGGRILDIVFEAKDIADSEQLSDRYCRTQGFMKIRTCPAIFNIQKFLDIVDDDPGRLMDTPEMFGINLERKELLYPDKDKDKEPKKIVAVK